MTKPRYFNRCAAGSQEPWEASSWAPSPADNAWIVNFNNGNANDYNRHNNARVRAVRSLGSGECQGDGQVRFRDLYLAWKRARRHKKPSANQMRFEVRWADRLFGLQERIEAGQWSPSPSMCFVALKPKAREIHAPDFSDRVVHHWLVPQLEAVIDRGFIHDSYANRKGKGTHAAVDRLETFVRQVHSGQGGGWYLQLDVSNFFNSIHRPTLWKALKRKMERGGLSLIVQRVAHALVRQSPLRAGVVQYATPEERAQVPRHKRLDRAPADCGLPIGNLSSQFLANLYLDALDQFVKHTLRAERYLRFVDDFVLVHADRDQLMRWKQQIEDFLRDHLRLGLKSDAKLLPLSAGIDFLGYVVYPTHRRVRARVVRHARSALSSWASGRIQAKEARTTPRDYRHLQSLWASYEGHFNQADAFRLRAQFHQRFPWLAAMLRRRRFHHATDDRIVSIGVW